VLIRSEEKRAKRFPFLSELCLPQPIKSLIIELSPSKTKPSGHKNAGLFLFFPLRSMPLFHL